MNVLITAPYNKEGLNVLEKEYSNIDYLPWKKNQRAFKPEELIDMLKKRPYDIFITEHDEVTASVIDSCPTLKIIGVCRGTPSNVDVDYASQKGIRILNTPGRNAQAVAELFIANVLIVYRKIIQAREWLLKGDWEEGAHTSYLQFKGYELSGKTVGMVGFGAVGQHIAKILDSFPAEIKYYDPYCEVAKDFYKSVSLDEVFETSDIVTINLPVNNSTKGLINKELIQKMKSHAIFVNMSRAVVVNRNDLLEALNNNTIAGAVVDVFDQEPPDSVDYSIIRHPNVLATPHIAGATFEVEDHHVEIMNKQLIKLKSEIYGRVLNN